MSAEIDFEQVAWAWKAFSEGRLHDCGEILYALVKAHRLLNEAGQFEYAARCIQRGMRWHLDKLTIEAVGRWANGDFANRNDFDQFLIRRAGDHMRYVQTAQWYLAVSNNGDAFSTYGVEVMDEHGFDWCAVATYALAQDVHDNLQLTYKIQGDTIPSAEKSRLCPACEKWEPLWFGELDSVCRKCRAL